MNIRDEQLGDAEAIHRVVTDAFGGEDEAKLVRALRAAGDIVTSLVAEDESRIVGHVLLSTMEAPFGAVALAPVSVTPSRQNCGIGAGLVRVSIERAMADGWDAIFVLGDPRYYRRFGFDIDAAGGFASPYAGPHFMMLALGDKRLATSGDLRHAPAFAALG